MACPHGNHHLRVVRTACMRRQIRLPRILRSADCRSDRCFSIDMGTTCHRDPQLRSRRIPGPAHVDGRTFATRRTDTCPRLERHPKMSENTNASATMINPRAEKRSEPIGLAFDTSTHAHVGASLCALRFGRSAASIDHCPRVGDRTYCCDMCCRSATYLRSEGSVP